MKTTFVSYRDDSLLCSALYKQCSYVARAFEAIEEILGVRVSYRPYRFFCNYLITDQPGILISFRLPPEVCVSVLLNEKDNTTFEASQIFASVSRPNFSLISGAEDLENLFEHLVLRSHQSYINELPGVNRPLTLLHQLFTTIDSLVNRTSLPGDLSESLLNVAVDNFNDMSLVFGVALRRLEDCASRCRAYTFYSIQIPTVTPPSQLYSNGNVSRGEVSENSTSLILDALGNPARLQDSTQLEQSYSDEDDNEPNYTHDNVGCDNDDYHGLFERSEHVSDNIRRTPRTIPRTRHTRSSYLWRGP